MGRFFCVHDDDGNLVEYEGGYFTYTTKELESTRNPITGCTTTNTQVGDEDSQLNMLKTTDKFSRTQQKAVQLRDLTNTTTTDFASVVTDYTYKTYGTNNDYAGGQVDTIRSYITYGEDMEEDNIIKDYVLSYEYDANGNITHEYTGTEKIDENLRYRYTYDEANQITRVDDNIQSKTYVYQYDKGGNRVSEKIYNYTLTDTLGTVQQEIVSEYVNLAWDDLLTSYNGKAITYDNAGNPLTYDGKTFVWDGKQLKEIIAQDGSKTVFDYDANGIRTRKIQYNAEGGIDYFVDYVWSDGKIVSQLLVATLRGTSNNEPIEVAIGPIASKVVYDDNGIPQGFTCGSACFGFVRNLQGDAIALVDYDGNIIAEYSYDPWGNIEYHINEDVNEVEALIITALCPLTYRGYNYDFTTGLYYLQSRYYNPEWGRFLNCDDTAILLSTQGQTHNANLFAYCANNPVNRVDYNGKYSTNLTTSVNAEIYQVMIFFILVYNNPISISVNPTAHKGVINIDLTETCPYMNGEFSDVLLTMYQIYKEQYGKDTAENIFYILAVISTYFFYYDFANLYNSQIANNNSNEKISRREFLFSDECVADEIKAHCEGYWYSIGKIDKTKDSIIMGAGALLVGRDLEEACKCISIAEQDAAAVDDRTVFGYFSGIRACYKNTNADPYWQGEFLGVNIRTYQNVRNEWKEEKISI